MWFYNSQHYNPGSPQIFCYGLFESATLPHTSQKSQLLPQRLSILTVRDNVTGSEPVTGSSTAALGQRTMIISVSAAGGVVVAVVLISLAVVLTQRMKRNK